MKKVFLVELELPKGVTVEEMEEYILVEVGSGKGRFSPMQPIFHLDRNTVTVQAAAVPVRLTGGVKF